MSTPTHSESRSRRDPWRRFAVVFGVLAVAAELAYYGVVVHSAPFDAYLAALTRTSALVLRGLGFDVGVGGSRLASPQVSLEVGDGCDALQLCALFAAAVVAVPAPLARRARALAIGLAGLQVLNLARIVSLFWIGVHFAGVFAFVHRFVWPGVLIAASALGWIAWVLSERRIAPDALA